jgi:hypothetical protein
MSPAFKAYIASVRCIDTSVVLLDVVSFAKTGGLVIVAIAIIIEAITNNDVLVLISIQIKSQVIKYIEYK